MSFSSNTNAAYPDVATTKRFARAAVRSVLKIYDAESKEYLSGRVLLPVRKADGVPQYYRVWAKLGLVLPHLMGSFQRRTLPVFFGKVNLTKGSMKEALVKLWKEGN